MKPPVDDSLIFNIVVSGDVNNPIEVIDPTAALRIAIVERGGIKTITDEWDKPGVYILLDSPRENGTWHAYIGKAPAGIRSRIKKQLVDREHWYRAILIKRNTPEGFHSGHVAWLEGRIYDLLSASARTDLHNAVRPIDDTLPPYEVRWLELAIEPIARLLRLLGHDCSTESEQSEQESAGVRNKFYGVTLATLIEAGLLEGNETLVSAFSTVPATATLCPDGSILYNGIVYGSVSAAAAEARGGSTNGWDMWAVPTPNGKVKLSIYRARYLEK